MNMKKLLKQVLSLLIVAVMLVGVCAPVISAAGSIEHLHKDNAGDGKLHYVSLGASNTNGYGHHGYLDDDIYEDPLAAPKAEMNDYGYDKAPANAYPALIRDALAEKTGREVELHQLAISSMRVEEVLWLLDDTYEPDEYMNWRFTGGKSWFDMAHKEGGREALRVEYRDYIANADVITVDLGWNNFGVYAFNNIMTILKEGGSRYWKAPDLDSIIGTDMEEEYYAIRDKVVERLGDFVDLSDTALSDDVISMLADVLAYAAFGACYNFDRVVEKIRALNPDAAIVTINIQNLADELVVNLDGVELPLGDLYGELIEFVDLYRSNFSPNKEEYLFAYAGVDGDVDTFLDEFRLWDGDPASLSQDMKDLFDMYDDNVYARSKIEYMMVGPVLELIFGMFSDIFGSFDTTNNYTYAFHFDMSMIDGVDLAELDFDNPDTDIERYGAAVSKHLYNLRHFTEDINPDPNVTTLGANAYDYVFTNMYNYYANQFGPDAAFNAIYSQDPENPGYYVQFMVVMKALYDVYVNTLNYAYDTVGTIIQYTLQFNTFYMTPDSMANHNSKTDELLGYVVDTFTNNTMLKFYDEIRPVANGFGLTIPGDPGIPAPEITVNEALFEDPLIQAVCALEVRYDFGNSFFAHPSVLGNKQIRDAVIDVLENGSHASDFGDKKANQYIDIVQDYLNPYYEEVYADLKANGTIDAMIAGLDVLDSTMDYLEQSIIDFEIPSDLKSERTDKIKVLLLDEIDNIRDTSKSLRIILGMETLDFDTDDYKHLVALQKNLENHINTIGNLTLEIGYFADPYIVELQKIVGFYAGIIKDMADESYNYLVNKVEGFNAKYLEFVELVGLYGDKIDPAIGAAIRAYLIDTPADAINILCEYGEEAVLKFVVDAANTIDNLGASIGALVLVLAEHGAEIYNEIAADEEYKQLVAAIEQKVANLMVLYQEANASPIVTVLDLDKIIAKEAAELSELYDQLVNVVIKNVEAYDEEVAELLLVALKDVINELDIILPACEDYLAWLGDHAYAMLGAMLHSLLENTLELGDVVDGVIWHKIDELKTYVENYINNLKKRIDNYLNELAKELCISLEQLRSDLINYITEYVKSQLGLIGDVDVDIDIDIEGIITAELLRLATEFSDVMFDALADALNGEYETDKDSYYVAITGNSSEYAEMLALALGLGDKHSVMGWDNIDTGILNKADFVTIGYDRTQISGFAIDQFLAAAAIYGNDSLREQIADYLAINNVPSDLANSIDDAIVSALERPEFAGKTVENLDWAKLVGEENVAYIEAILEDIADRLAEKGIDGDYVVSVNVVEFLDKYLPNEGATIDLFDNNPVFELTVPAADIIMVAVESYIYANIMFNIEYADVILGLIENNPDVTIAVLGQYNPFMDITVHGVAIPLAEIYDKFVAASNLNSLAYALTLPNVTYIDISEVQTNWSTIDDSLEFLQAYLSNPKGDIFTDDSNLYVMNQIFEAYGLSCKHYYDSCTDMRCNICGEIRSDVGHKYDAVITQPDCVNDGCTTYTCAICGHSYVENITNALGHKYDNACDADCNVCGEKRTPADHEYGDWVVVLEPTEDAEGMKERTCLICGHIDRISIDRIEKSEEELGVAETIAIICGIIVITAGVGAAVAFTIKKRRIKTNK